MTTSPPTPLSVEDVIRLEGRELDAAVANLTGLQVVAMDWPCWIDHDDGSVRASGSRDERFIHEEDETELHPVYVPEYGWWPPRPDPEMPEGYGDFAFVEPVPFYSATWEAAMSLRDKVNQWPEYRRQTFVRCLDRVIFHRLGREEWLKRVPSCRVLNSEPIDIARAYLLSCPDGEGAQTIGE
jgi:hypothetical protein